MIYDIATAFLYCKQVAVHTVMFVCCVCVWKKARGSKWSNTRYCSIRVLIVDNIVGNTPNDDSDGVV